MVKVIVQVVKKACQKSVQMAIQKVYTEGLYRWAIKTTRQLLRYYIVLYNYIESKIKKVVKKDRYFVHISW